MSITLYKKTWEAHTAGTIADGRTELLICASSSNRNYKGRQGIPAGRTILMSPAIVVAAMRGF